MTPINLFSQLNTPGSFYSSLTDGTSVPMTAFLRRIPFCPHLRRHSGSQSTLAEWNHILYCQIVPKDGTLLCFFLTFSTKDSDLHLRSRQSPHLHQLLCLVSLPVTTCEHSSATSCCSKMCSRVFRGMGLDPRVHSCALQIKYYYGC